MKFKDVVLDVIHMLALCRKSEIFELNTVSELGWEKSGSTMLLNADFSVFDMLNDMQNDLRKVEMTTTKNMLYAKNIASG